MGSWVLNAAREARQLSSSLLDIAATAADDGGTQPAAGQAASTSSRPVTPATLTQQKGIVTTATRPGAAANSRIEGSGRGGVRPGTATSSVGSQARGSSSAAVFDHINRY